uniref:DUF4005 domain-containing protein n=1 Tax=Oryza punctata TaxID=4537 RepID=A0A0E0L3I6_ORYPU
MGKKGKWFDAVQRVLSTSENDRQENERKVTKDHREIALLSHQILFYRRFAILHELTDLIIRRCFDREKGKRSTLKKILQFSKSNPSTSSPPVTAPATRQQLHRHPPPQAEAKSAETEQSAAAAAQKTATAVSRPTTTAPRAPARSAEELAAVKIQRACRVYLGRRSQQARGFDRLMLLLEGLAVKRQTYEALYCMQTMTRVQTQIHSRRVKTEEDKKALKSQVRVKQSPDKTKWSNRKPSSARAAPPPMFMDTANPNWGWSWAERWMAAARPWESQTTPGNSGRAPAAAKGGAGGRRVSMSVQIPTTPAGARFTRPPSFPSPSTPTPRSPWRTSAVPPTSPGGSPFRRSTTTGLRRTTSLQEERPRSSQERRAMGSVSPVHGEKGSVVLSLRRTTSLRSGEMPRRLSLGGGAAAPAATARDDAPPLTPSYMQTTKSVKAKAARPAAIEVPLLAERMAPDHPQVTSPSVINRRLSLGSADKQSVPSPSKAKAERSTPRRSRPPSPRF